MKMIYEEVNLKIIKFDEDVILNSGFGIDDPIVDPSENKDNF